MLELDHCFNLSSTLRPVVARSAVIHQVPFVFTTKAFITQLTRDSDTDWWISRYSRSLTRRFSGTLSYAKVVAKMSVLARKEKHTHCMRAPIIPHPRTHIQAVKSRGINTQNLTKPPHPISLDVITHLLSNLSPGSTSAQPLLGLHRHGSDCSCVCSSPIPGPSLLPNYSLAHTCYLP